MIVINLYAGPSAGKSTLAADIFAKLKRAGIQAEVPQEVAKIRAQRGDIGFLEDQLAVFAETHHQLSMTAKSGAAVAVLDSPVLLSLIYAPDNYLKSFPALVREVYDQYANVNYVLGRSASHRYSMVGRVHTEPQAHEIDGRIIRMLNEQKLHHRMIDSSEFSAQCIVDGVLERLGIAQAAKQPSRTAPANQTKPPKP